MVRGEPSPKDQYYAEKSAKTLYIRTVRDIKGDFQLLFLFNLFGVQTIMNDEFEKAKELYAQICDVKKIIDNPRSVKKMANKELVNALTQLRTVLGQSEDLLREYKLGYEQDQHDEAHNLRMPLIEEVKSGQDQTHKDMLKRA